MRRAAIRHVVRHLAVVVAMAMAAGLSTASAQDRLFLFGQEVGTHGRFGQKIGDLPSSIRRSSDPEFVGGGRYVKTAEYILVGSVPSERWVLTSRVFDTFTGREIPLPSYERVVADPIRPRVFVLNGQDVRAFALDTGATTVLATARSVPNLPSPPGVPPLPDLLPGARYAQNVRQLFVRRANSSATAWEAAVIDVETGSLIRTLPDPGSTIFGGEGEWTVVPDGTRLFSVGGGTLGTGLLGVRAIDANTGAVVATVSASGQLRWDDVFQRLYVVGHVSGALKAFDSQLTPLGQTDGGYCLSNVRISAHTGRLYHLRAAGGDGGYYGAIDTRLEAFDGATGARLADASVTEPLGFGTDRPACGEYTMLLATAPGAPRDLTEAVTGHDVTLAWTNVGDASGFVLDIGFAPGRTDLSMFLGGSTQQTTFADIPSGRYFARVRGGNTFGGSQPSNEVTIVVP